MSAPPPDVPPLTPRSLALWALALVALPAAGVAWLRPSLPPDPLAALAWPQVGAEAADARDPAVGPSHRALRAAADALAVTAEPGAPTEGYELRVLAGSTEVTLHDASGAVRHRWQAEWDSFGLPTDLNPRAGSFRAARLAPDGGVYVLVEGIGVVAVDRAGGHRWTVAASAHDAFEVLPDGHLRVLTREMVQLREVARTRSYPVDHVVEYSEAGRQLARIDLLQVYRATDLAWLPIEGQMSVFGANWLQTGADGFVYVAMRERGVVAVVDPATKRLVREEPGPWTHLGAFADLPDGGRRVLDHGPEHTLRVWTVGADGAERARWDLGIPWNPAVPGSLQVLPDGHTRIAAGPIRELDADGRVVSSVDPLPEPPVSVLQSLRLPADCCGWLAEEGG
jgi:hypothetical protein